MKKVLFTSVFTFLVGVLFASNRHLLSTKSGDAQDLLKIEVRNEKILEKQKSEKRKSERDWKEKLRALLDSPRK